MRADRGFTMLETLCALAILAVALVTFYGAAGTSLTASSHAAKVDQAILFAQSKLDEIAATRTSFPTRSNGTFANSDIRWGVTAETISSPDLTRQNIALQAIHLELQWRDGLHEQSLIVETRHLGLVVP